MRLYLYSCRDLIAATRDKVITIAGGDVFSLKICDDEHVFIYPAEAKGVIVLTRQQLLSRCHDQIIFYDINNDAILCEIKPFVYIENCKRFTIGGSNIDVVESAGLTHVYFNNEYQGCVKSAFSQIDFQNIKHGEREYALLCFGQNKKYILLASEQEVKCLYGCVDSEVNSKWLSIYRHEPNIFNVGQLIKFDLESGEVVVSAVCDRGDECKQMGHEFDIIYFLDAVLCARWKLAYSKLSYELKSSIDQEVLKQYFSDFDKYIYLVDEDVYIRIKNNKVVGINHFVVNNHLIDDIC